MKRRTKIGVILLLLCFAAGNLAAKGGTESATTDSGEAKFERDIMLIVPYSPGSANDASAQLFKRIGEKYIPFKINVEYKPGGNTSIGTMFMLSQPRDGHTVCMPSTAAEFHVATGQTEGMYDEFSYVSLGQMAAEQSFFIVHKNSPFNSFTEVINYAKANPEKIRWGASGTLSNQHFILLRIAQATGIKVTYIPYEDGGRVTTAVLGEHIEIGGIAHAVAASLRNSSEVKFLAQTLDKRDPSYSSVPTIFETPGCEVEKLGGPFTVHRSIIAPADSPKSVLRAWDELFAKVTSDPEFTAFLQTQGIPLSYIPGEKHTEMVRSSTQQIRELYKTMKNTIKK